MSKKNNSKNKKNKVLLDLAHSTGHLIKVAHRAFQQTLQVLLEQHDVKLSHWHCLRYLYEEDGLTQKELCDRVNIRESTIVAVITDMESIGLISRIRDTTDRRKYAVCLTAKGKRTTKKLLPLAKNVNDMGVNDFTKAEIRLYHSLTQRIITNLSAIDYDKNQG